ncbi:methionyl-tRNA formyltransferase [Synergistales bacterium]|nr:methionyl-tRNA formyltransferase [Synergistales bacterium]
MNGLDAIKIWFVGGGGFAASCLAHMSKSLRFEKIITSLPTRAGRGLSEQLSRVEETALGLALSVERVSSLSKDQKITESLLLSPPDLAFVIDFGQIIKEPLLNAPRFGCLNIHPSLLPLWRGAAPVQRAILAGDAKSGVTLFRLVEEMDAGPILRQAEVPVPINMSANELFDVLAFTGSQIAIESVEFLSKGEAFQYSEQNHELATYADKLSKAEAEVRWSLDALQIHNSVRAFASSVGAFTFYNGKRLKLWRTEPRDSLSTEGGPVAVCGKGYLRLVEVQPEGKRKMSGAEWLRGLGVKSVEIRFD